MYGCKFYRVPNKNIFTSRDLKNIIKKNMFNKHNSKNLVFEFEYEKIFCDED